VSSAIPYCSGFLTNEEIPGGIRVKSSYITENRPESEKQQKLGLYTRTSKLILFSVEESFEHILNRMKFDKNRLDKKTFSEVNKNITH
jgi:hypothetical protein